MSHHDKILTGKMCPYCGGKTKWVDSKVIYGTSYGMIYLCEPCDAYVGVHHGKTKKALGRLANKELREAKKEAHYYFDALWKAKMNKGFDKNTARSVAYKWLSDQMNIPLKYTHIGMFDIDECQIVVRLCKPYFK